MNDSASARKPSAEKPPRSPVERVLVWGVIIVLLGLTAYEARAKLGYDGSYNTLKTRLDEVESSSDTKAIYLLEDFKKEVSGGAHFSEPENGRFRGRSTVNVKWSSLFKQYELILTLGLENQIIGFESAGMAPEPSLEERSNVDPNAPVTTPNTPSGMPVPGAPSTGEGQQGQGQGQGNRGRGRGLIGLLGQEDVQAELKLTAEQIAELEPLQESIQADSPNLTELREKLQEASEEEQAAIREEMRSAQQLIAEKTLAGLSALLDETQLTRLKQIDWQRQGPVALATADVTAALQLSDEQKTQLQTISEARQAAMRELGFQAPAEQRAELTATFNAQFLDVLTDEQKQAWEALLGPAFEPPTE